MRKYLLLTLVFLQLLGCGDSFKKDINKGASAETLSESVDLSNKYELDLYVFDSKKTLTEDLNIHARDVIFLSGSTLILNEYNVNIKTENLEFNTGVDILGFEEYNYNGCYKDGKDSGSFNVEANSVQGSPTISLIGQDAGLAGMYTKASSKIKLRSSHIEKDFGGAFYENECLGDFEGYPKDMGKYKRSYNGGLSGVFRLNAAPTETFSPIISKRVSHGSYQAYVNWGNKNVGGYITNEEGADGNKTLICYLIDGEELCH